MAVVTEARSFTRVLRSLNGERNGIKVLMKDGHLKISEKRFPLKQVIFGGRVVVRNVFGLGVWREQRRVRTLAEDINTNG